jgi:hypothetical protein
VIFISTKETAQAFITKLNTTAISIKKYLTIVITNIYMLYQFWETLPLLFKGMMVLVVIFSIIECFTGIKPMSVQQWVESAKRIIDNVKASFSDDNIKNGLETCKTALSTFTDLYLQLDKIKTK